MMLLTNSHEVIAIATCMAHHSRFVLHECLANTDTEMHTMSFICLYLPSHHHPALKDGDKFWRMPEAYLRGNTIKYIRVPEEVR
jgi:hypothetical protein